LQGKGTSYKRWRGKLQNASSKLKRISTKAKEKSQPKGGGCLPFVMRLLGI
jgi:hypothetical protein